MKRKVFWTEEEILILSKGCFEHLLKNFGRKLLWQVLASSEVQGLLPSDRRRNITGDNQVPIELKKLIQVMTDELVSSQDPVLLEVPVVRYIQQVVKSEDLLAKLTNEQLFVEVGRRLSTVLDVMKNSRLVPFQELPTSVKIPVSENQPKVTEKPIKTRIALVGFLADQNQYIIEKTRTLGSVELIPVDSKGRKVITNLPEAEWFVVMSKASHAQYGHVDRSSSNHILYVNGVTGATKAIADIHAKVSNPHHSE